MTTESQLSWDSPKMREVKQEWDSLWDTYTETPEKISRAKKDTYRELVRMQSDLLRKRLSDDEVRRLAATCGSLPVHWRDWSDFDKAVVRFMLEVLVYSRDRESLVTLLSTRFPLRIGNWPIEFYLAQQAGLDNPILVLGEAYSKCAVPEVRHDIAAAVRRAFGGLGVTGRDDADFVTNAMRWYENEKEHLTVDSSNSPTGYCDEYLPLEPEEGYPGQYEKVWSHRPSLFMTQRNVEQPGGGIRQSDQPKSETLGQSADGTSPQRKIDGQAEDELTRLNGTWEVIEATDSGNPVPRAEIKGVRFVFHKDMLEWIGRDGKKEGEFRVRLGGQEEPSAMDLVETPKSAPKKEQTTALVHELQEETTSAIYELKGDALRMCLPRRGAWQRPSSFKAEGGSHEASFTLKRVGGKRE